MSHLLVDWPVTWRGIGICWGTLCENPEVPLIVELVARASALLWRLTYRTQRCAPSSDWVLLDRRSGDSLRELDHEVFVIADSAISSRKARRLVCGLEESGSEIVGSLQLERTSSARFPVRVAAAGFEVGFSERGAVRIPLMEGVVPLQGWGDLAHFGTRRVGQGAGCHKAGVGSCTGGGLGT